MAERFLNNGGHIHFGIRALGVEQQADAATVLAVAGEGGEPGTIQCRFAAACDGARSALLGGIEGASVFEWQHPFRWLALIAGAPRSKPRTLYGFHPRGFAGQLRRGPTLTRFMLEVPHGNTLGEWPDERIWRELQQRLRAKGEPELAEGPFIERDVLDLRVRVIEPMHHHRLYLAGDSAHPITPAAGKGRNLAIQLGLALRESLGGDPHGTRLAAYSSTSLPAIWRTDELAHGIGGKAVAHLAAADGLASRDLLPGQLCNAATGSWPALAATDPPPGAALLMVPEPPPQATAAVDRPWSRIYRSEGWAQAVALATASLERTSISGARGS